MGAGGGKGGGGGGGMKLAGHSFCEDQRKGRGKEEACCSMHIKCGKKFRYFSQCGNYVMVFQSGDNAGVSI